MEENLNRVDLKEEDCWIRNNLQRIVYNSKVLLTEKEIKPGIKLVDEENEVMQKIRNTWKKNLDESDICVVRSWPFRVRK